MSEKEVVTIKELAEARLDVNNLVNLLAEKVEADESSEAFKALQDAIKARTDSPEYKEWAEVEADLRESRKEHDEKLARFREQKIEAWRKDPKNKTYDGGGIQNRKRLVYDEAQLIDYLVNRKWGGFLLVNDKAVKELSPGALEYLEMTGFVGYEDKPVATIDKDLSRFLEDGDND